MTRVRRILLASSALVALMLGASVILYWLAGRGLQSLDDAARSQAPGKFLTLPEGKLYYRWDGPENGTPLVMIHGFSMAHGIFDRNAAVLAASGYRVLRMDNWGRGWSDRPALKHEVDLFDRQVLGALDALGLKQPIDVVGLSMGGGIAVAFTARHPERVRKLALIAPAGLPFERPLSARVATWPLVGDWIMRVFGRRILLGGKTLADPALQAQWVADAEASMRFPGYLDGLASTLRHYPLNGLEGDYARVGATGKPVLLVWGDKDDTVPYAVAPRATELSRGRLVTIPGASHAVNTESAAEVNAALLHFFAS